ncbi:MAG TPA: hypothetical protein G4N92_01900 [Anaerolineae bacterium]|nr:hypothetical protein [Anaerolineae bacterium]
MATNSKIFIFIIGGFIVLSIYALGIAGGLLFFTGNNADLVPGINHISAGNEEVFGRTAEPNAHKTEGKVGVEKPTDSNISDFEEIPIHFQTLETLRNMNVPENDVYEIAARLDGIKAMPVFLENDEPIIYILGDQREFWVLNIDSNSYQLVNAELKYETDHLYFWVGDGVSYKQEDLAKLAETFEHQIYPIDRTFFGSEKTPGIDNDQHLSILYTNGMGGAAGYFSSSDTVLTEINEYSNKADMFYLSAEVTHLYQDFTYGVLAHEFQHMIHWNQDRNETTWINEGFSELAVLLNGYDIGGFDYIYALNPDLQLNDWPGDDQGSSSPHYGSSFLFMTYFLHRFGEDLSKSLVTHPLNGMDSIDAVLMEAMVVDPATTDFISADDVFQDWTVANFVQDVTVYDGKYDYSEVWEIPFFYSTETIECPSSWQSRQVKQYGVDYIRLNCSQEALLEFQGTEIVQILPVDAYSGEYFFWSNKGDESDMRLTKTFDFTDIDTSLHLKYKVWFDIERDYDYLYLLASEDGENWQIIKTPSCTEENPTGANHGCAYNGKSEGWITETVDLSQFSGKNVILQFEYITDAAINGEGFALDDVSIPEMGYFTDFEKDDGGWIAFGFVRIANHLPQTYKLALIRIGSQSVQIEKLHLNEQNEIEVMIPAVNGDGEQVILVVSGITRYTRIPADYSVHLTAD